MTTHTLPGDDDQTLTALSDSAHDYLRRVDHRARVRALRNSEPSFGRDYWRGMADAGWLSALVSEEDGGLGLGLRAAAQLGIAVGAHLLPEPFVAAGVHPALTLNSTPAGELRSWLLSGLTEGALLMGCAWQQSPGQLDPQPGPVRLHEEGAQCFLSGETRFVEPGAGVDGWLVFAVAGGEATLAWVARDASGVSVNCERRVDGGLWAAVRLDHVRIPRQNCVARGDAAYAAFGKGIEGARLIQAAELLGLGRQALSMTLDYMKARTQFGRPIGSFQALQHRLVDAKIQVELAAASLEDALRDSSDARRLTELASRAKARAASSALAATRLAIQLHGAIGYTDACDIGLYFKRALALNASLGTALQHRRRYLDHAVAPSGQNAVSLPPNVDELDWEQLSEPQVRAVVRRFLDSNYPKALRHLPRNAYWHEVRSWYATLCRKGWNAPAWPKAYGGMGLSAAKMMAFHEEMMSYGVARWVDIAVEMLGPLLINFGTEEQRRTYLPRILTGEHVWCQGYSEPNAGSDLVSLRTTAELHGEHFKVNGRKIWTSYAQEATHIFMLVRTDRTAKPAAGISFLLVDMQTPGIRVNPIEDLRGDAPFCELTFDDVPVPVANLVGELHQGWSIAKALLGFERLFIGSPAPVAHAMVQLRTLARERRLSEDPAFRARFAELELDLADLNALYNRFADILRRGQPVSADISMLKVYSTETWQRVAAFLSEAADESGACLESPSVNGEELQLLPPTFNSLPSTIYGGSSEIQRNILARQVLGLPA